MQSAIIRGKGALFHSLLEYDDVVISICSAKNLKFKKRRRRLFSQSTPQKVPQIILSVAKSQVNSQ